VPDAQVFALRRDGVLNVHLVAHTHDDVGWCVPRSASVAQLAATAADADAATIAAAQAEDV